jgi:mitogen-activated protein kinase kinase
MTIKPDSTKTVTPASVKRGAANGQPTIAELLANLKLPVIEGESADLSRLQWDDDQLEDLGRLGEGAGGSVNRVRDRKTGKIIAKKAIPQPSTPPVQLIRELQFISTCVHENITAFYGAYLTPPKSKNGPELCLLMEFCEGGSLEAISRQVRKAKARIGEKVVGRVAESVLKGLAYLHSRKIIHRDIKPSNILITRAGIVKLCDFGVSGELVDSVAGTFTGTGYYMAPERISGQQYTVRSDVWSTGLTLLELAMNKFPYPPDLGVIELLSYIVSGEVPKLTDEPGAEWSADMKDFIAVCLTVDAQTRPRPGDMLHHPWVAKSGQAKVNMAKWVRQVWGWSDPTVSRRRKNVELERELERGFVIEEDAH